MIRHHGTPEFLHVVSQGHAIHPEWLNTLLAQGEETGGISQWIFFEMRCDLSEGRYTPPPPNELAQLILEWLADGSENAFVYGLEGPSHG